jgi:hypothetical protein
MKRVVVLCFVLMVQGLNSFGQTNATPPAAHPVQHPEPQVQKAVATNSVSVPAAPVERTLSRTAEMTPADLAMFRRIKEEGLLAPRRPTSGRNTWASTESIFRSNNDQMGETCIRDTYITIFPTGR